MLRRCVSAFVALVLTVQGALAIAASPCHPAGDDAPPAAAANADHGARHGGHDGHAMHDDGAPSPHGCADDCRCTDSCTASGLHAIALPASAWPASYASLVPDRAPGTGRAPAHSARLLRPPIAA